MGDFTHTIGDSHYALVGAYLDDGVQIIDITDPTTPSPVAALTDGVGGFNTLDSPRGITTHTIGNKHYALVAARFDYGVQIIDITDPAMPLAAAAVTNGSTYQLDGPINITTHTVGNKHYALVVSERDDGMQIIDITDPTSPAPVAAVTDGVGGYSELDGPFGVTVHIIGNRHYALVASVRDDGVQIVELLTNFSPEFADDDVTFTVVESATSGTVGTVTATDTAGETLIYSVGGTDEMAFNGDFTLNPSTGGITVKSSATIELNTKSLYEVTITATDPFNAVDTIEVRIEVDPASDIANFRATPGNRRVTLEWDNPGDSTIQRYQYRLMSTSDSGWNPDWRSISGTNANTTSIRATGLTNGIEYTFQVRPTFLDGQLLRMGKEGEIKSVSRGALVAPRNLAAVSAGDGELALSWDDPRDITLTGFQYRYRNPSDSDWNPDWTDVSGSGATTTSHTLAGLTNNVLYTLEVRSLRGVTGGPAARATQKPRGPLAAPANLAAASGQDRRATLSWDNSGDESITRFQYRYRISTVSAWNPDWTDIPGSRWTTTSYTVRNLVNRTGYTFEVRALRGTLEGPASSGTATPEGPPSVPLPPEGLTVHPADRSLGLSWDPPVMEDSRAPVTGYRVRYREEGRSWRTVSRSAGLLRWQTIAALRNGSAYEVQVASVNSVGAGAWAETRGVPEAPQVGAPPPQPQGAEAFDVGSLGVWWVGTDPNGNFWGNDRQMDSCAGTHPFTVIWSGPEDDRNAEELGDSVRTTSREALCVPEASRSLAVDRAPAGSSGRATH